MTDHNSAASATEWSRWRTALAAVLAISVAALVWLGAWYFLGWHYWGMAWLASKAAVKAVILGPPLLAGVVIWLRQRLRRPAPQDPDRTPPGGTGHGGCR
ncbi:hypothetical protein [Streptomyces sp. NBC_00083]|uniref:hypothetical protein n=1 Tax=Streptomyces sp. NBC_00083 TaxID=2975647 RepID=UPI002255EC90|nr:hypothetical protein [Streptomyces sp. NBC_00083]MCX5384796.1 hypothetical protein [Streptomyces sp. NBC_00083]